ncbi:S1C family serine protease, partial [[Eubacterium] cellulosolvens]
SNYGLIPYAEGSGFIYRKDGFIITNNHVVEGTDSIEVTFLDGAIAEAYLVGADPYSDLAVIKVSIAQRDLPPMIIGNSSSLMVGDPVLAIGNPYGLSGSMTEGIVSQLDRTLSTENGYLIVGVIQTDAAINPGNSGGPLLNMWGEVVGVNSAIASQSGDFSGVGFAIPSNLMVQVANSLIDDKHYTHPWLGLAGVDMTPAIAVTMNLDLSRGFLVTYVAPESPVKKAGIRAGNKTVIIDGKKINVGGDVIIGIDDINVRGLEDLLVYIEYNRRPHDTVTLKIIRDTLVQSLTIELEERPSPTSST